MIHNCSAKVIVQLGPPPSHREQGPCVKSEFSYIRLSFRKGGHSDFYSLYKQELLRKAWEIAEKPAAATTTQDKVKPSSRVR
jgi:hypothetical protein